MNPYPFTVAFYFRSCIYIMVAYTFWIYQVCFLNSISMSITEPSACAILYFYMQRIAAHSFSLQHSMQHTPGLLWLNIQPINHEHRKHAYILSSEPKDNSSIGADAKQCLRISSSKIDLSPVQRERKNTDLLKSHVLCLAPLEHGDSFCFGSGYRYEATFVLFWA